MHPDWSSPVTCSHSALLGRRAGPASPTDPPSCSMFVLSHSPPRTDEIVWGRYGKQKRVLYRDVTNSCTTRTDPARSKMTCRPTSWGTSTLHIQQGDGPRWSQSNVKKTLARSRRPCWAVPTAIAPSSSRTRNRPPPGYDRSMAPTPSPAAPSWGVRQTPHAASLRRQEVALRPPPACPVQPHRTR